MAVESLSMNTVQLLADKVFSLIFIFQMHMSFRF